MFHKVKAVSALPDFCLSVQFAEGVTKRYDGFTLDNISFDVPKGCIMGFIGQNGAG